MEHASSRIVHRELLTQAPGAAEGTQGPRLSVTIKRLPNNGLQCPTQDRLEHVSDILGASVRQGCGNRQLRFVAGFSASEP